LIFFSSHISFHKANCCFNKSKTAYFSKLNKLIFNALLEPNIVLVTSDTSIKNNIAIFITYIHLFNSSLKKTLHHAIDITSTETELFALRYGINQTIQIYGFSHIIVITDTLYMVQKIFNLSIHLYQLQSIMISKDLQELFG